LDQELEALALLVDSAPQVHPYSGDAHDHFVQVPAIARPEPPLPQLSRDKRTELQNLALASPTS
jgi:hypothetical protein